MRVFVIFGNIEFLDDDEYTALVHSVDHATHMFEGQIENYARSIDKDYLMLSLLL